MASLSTPLRSLILKQLADHEMQLLTLVVSVRKSLVPADRIKGDLTGLVKSAIRQLILNKVVVETDGMFSLINPAESASPKILGPAIH